MTAMSLRTALCALVLLIDASKCVDVLPSFFSVCRRSDPNLNQCLLEAGRKTLKKFSKGVPEMGVPPVDPMDVDAMNIIGVNTGFRVKLWDTKIYGLGDSQLDLIKVDFTKKKVVVKFTSVIEFVGQYKINGTFLILPITGEGPYSSKIGSSNCTYKYDYTLYKDAKNRDHFNITKHDLKCTNNEKTTFNMTNLLGGDKFLGEAMNGILNDNWREVFKDVKPACMAVMSESSKRIMNQFYKNVPVDVMLPP